MIVVLVHGISDNRDNRWPSRWLHAIQDKISTTNLRTRGISWESIHESRYNPTKSHRKNLLQDLGALTNPAVQRHFQSELKHFENSDETIWIIAHSLGTVLAYQALDWLQRGQSQLYIRRFITVGCPLWIPFSRITKRISLLNVVMPRATKLGNVHRWINISGRFDAVAGFGLVDIPTVNTKLKCWTRHSFYDYAETKAFEQALRGV